MNRKVIYQLHNQLSDRDQAILTSLERFRLLDTRQVQRLHFPSVSSMGHTTPLAAARACNRGLRRLQELGLVTALERRIGGVRRGSASYIWQLAPLGERYLRETRGHARRRRYLEPGAQFVHHTLAVNDIAVALLEAHRDLSEFTLEQLGTEPGNWRRFLGAAGETRWLKPDLHVVTGIDATPIAGARAGQAEEAYEEHVFIEVDLGSEHAGRILAKCRVYADYAATGAYQARHGLFPAVVWVSPDKARRAALRAAVAAVPPLPPGLCRITSPEDYLTAATGANAAASAP